jgi:hypothetical protein
MHLSCLAHAGNNFAVLPSLRVKLVRGVPIAFKSCAIRLTAKVRHLAAPFAGPCLSIIQSAKNYGVSAGKNELNLIKHA